MATFSTLTRATVLMASAGLLAAGIATPALAGKDIGKPLTVTMPASALKDPSSKVCMPRTVIDKSKTSTLPKTVCMTQEEWAAKGVTFVSKK